jgi:hypothetical protein
MWTSLQYKCVNKQNTLSPSPKGFQSPKFSDSDFREVRGLGLGLGRPKSSAYYGSTYSGDPSTLHVFYCSRGFVIIRQMFRNIFCLLFLAVWKAFAPKGGILDTSEHVDSFLMVNNLGTMENQIFKPKKIAQQNFVRAPSNFIVVKCSRAEF